jgi:hypothetical protein
LAEAAIEERKIMPIRRHARARRQLPENIDLILCCGHDFFGDLPGGVKDNLDLLRAAWQDESIRAAVIERHKRKHRPGVPWAQEKFGV